VSGGSFVISLDMELMWGVRDHRSKDDYGHRVLGERNAIPAMLDVFERNGIEATWAVVGFAMCDGRDELLARAPADRPSYANPRYSSYSYVAEAGASERQDPYYFAPSLIRQIVSCPRQELATHTFSHYYCLEEGQTPGQFAADLDSAIRQIADWNETCSSIIFPRNQYSDAYLEVCAAKGLRVFRGNERSWFYRSVGAEEQNPFRRLGRAVDTFVPLTGSNTHRPERRGPMIDVASSRILRPYSARLRRLDSLRLARITGAMSRAAAENAIFHLWWHPHNFGADTAENIAFLERVVGHYRRLSETRGMRSATMRDAAA
jgi:peptidoglycan/xylan/chitin deacetylase (PgdA/CDA1 family)